MQLLLLAAFGLDGFAHAAEALVGDAVGKHNHKGFIATCRQCGWWSPLTAGAFSGLYILLGPSILGLMSSIPEVVSSSLEYLPWLWMLPLAAVASYLLDGIFIGATQTQAMQSTMLLAAGAVYLPCWFITRDWGNHGLWLAFLLFNGARGVLLGVCFLRYQQQQRWWQ